MSLFLLHEKEIRSTRILRGRSRATVFSYIDRFYDPDRGYMYKTPSHGRHTSRNRHGTICIRVRTIMKITVIDYRHVVVK